MSEIIKNITVILCVVLCVAGGIWAWWIENGPSRDGKGSKDANVKNGYGKEEENLKKEPDDSQHTKNRMGPQ